MNGATGQVVYNFNKWVSAVGDVGYYTHNPVPSTGLIGLTIKPTEISYLLGPRVSTIPTSGAVCSLRSDIDWHVPRYTNDSRRPR